MKFWALVHHKEPENKQDLLMLNSEIRIGKNVLFWKKNCTTAASFILRILSLKTWN